MKEKYELKITGEQLDALEKRDGGYLPFPTHYLIHDARLAHELLERVAFLERVAEQAVGFACIDYLPEKEVETYYGTTEQLGDGLECTYCHLRGGCEEYPELAQYLREREVEK